MVKMVIQNNGSHLQPSTLLKLICTRCKRYLSYPPIYRLANNDDPVCGRCSSSSTENFVRNELFEHAVEFQKFPCIYYENGCLENLFPRQVPDHEKRCCYKKYDCPTRVYNNCTWQGTTHNILEHFEKAHPTFVLKDCQFEIDFVNSHTENYIMPFAEDIYVVTRQANPAKKMFSLIVSYLGSNIRVEKYKYNVNLESGNKTFKFSISEDIGKQIHIQSQVVRDKLHDPVIIIANISIQAPSIHKELGLQNTMNPDEDMSNPDIDYNQLSELECPVCMYYMVPPIYQCERGHSICCDCREAQKECPTCRGPIHKTQNFVLEKIINNMIYPCKHAGCKYTAKAKDIRKHEETCLFGPFECPLQDYENCSEVFPVSELFNHIQEKHYECLLELDTISIPIEQNIDEDIIEAYVIKYSQVLFKLCFKYISAEDTFLWSVQLIGPAEESSKYNYELEIIDNNGKNIRLYVKTNCSPLVESTKTFENKEHFIYFKKDQVLKFINNQLTYRIRISEY